MCRFITEHKLQSKINLSFDFQCHQMQSNLQGNSENCFTAVGPEHYLVREWPLSGGLNLPFLGESNMKNLLWNWLLNFIQNLQKESFVEKFYLEF